MLTDDLIATFSRAQAAFTERVHAVAPDQWQLGTPDTQWAVADLVGHLVDEHRWATPLPSGPVAAIYPLAQAIVDRTPAGMFDPSSAPGVTGTPPAHSGHCGAGQARLGIVPAG